MSHFALLHGLMRRRWWDALPGPLRDRARRGAGEELFRDIGGCPLRRSTAGAGTGAGAGADGEGPLFEVAESRGWDGAAWPLSPTEMQPHLGFMWSDFMVEDETILPAPAPGGGKAPGRVGGASTLYYRRGRGFGFGRELTEYVLRTSGIVGVMRAHQHNDNAETGAMLSAIKSATPPGVFDNFGRAGLVLTFLSGALIPGQGFGHDAYGLVRLRGAASASWSVDVCANRVGAPPNAARGCSASHEFACADMGWRASAAAREPPPADWPQWRACLEDDGPDSGAGADGEL